MNKLIEDIKALEQEKFIKANKTGNSEYPWRIRNKEYSKRLDYIKKNHKLLRNDYFNALDDLEDAAQLLNNDDSVVNRKKYLKVKKLVNEQREKLRDMQKEFQDLQEKYGIDSYFDFPNWYFGRQ